MDLIWKHTQKVEMTAKNTTLYQQKTSSIVKPWDSGPFVIQITATENTRQKLLELRNYYV